MPLAPPDDFGFVEKWRRRRGAGECTPRSLIGATLADFQPEKEVTVRLNDSVLSELEMGTIYCRKDLTNSRRLRKTVLDGDGAKVDSQRPSSGTERPQGIRAIALHPTPNKSPFEGTKRCFEWATSQPTGPDNPKSWEEPVEPGKPVCGKRPSHPVCATGIVALEHKRDFPELRARPTADPGNPLMSKAPFGNGWGGWAASGAPGRKVLQGPWDSLEPSQKGHGVSNCLAGEPKQSPRQEEETEYRFCDARTRRFPELTAQPTFHLTRWHLDAKNDLEVYSAKRVHTNHPLGQERCPPPAGGRTAR